MAKWLRPLGFRQTISLPRRVGSVKLPEELGKDGIKRGLTKRIGFPLGYWKKLRGNVLVKLNRCAEKYEMLHKSVLKSNFFHALVQCAK